MTFNKLFLALTLTILVTAPIIAENGINSPYSRFGFGILSDQNLGVNRQMGGLGYGLRDKSYINLLNPASFSVADTTTILFEAGFSLQNVNFKENNTKINALNSSFDYIAMEFRLSKGLGMSLGFLPYSNVGYSFSNNKTYHYPDMGGDFSAYDSYNGNGGLSQPFVGLGYNILPNLSVGVMGSYLYGDITHSISSSFTDSSIRNRIRYYSLSVSSYKLDFGIQYSKNIGEKNQFIFGGTYSLGHDLNGDALYINQVLSGSSIQSADTVKHDKGFKLPNTYGIGLTYTYDGKFTAGVDYTYQGWGTSAFFGEDKGVNRSKISVGLGYYANELTRNFFKRIHYRAGFYYAQPYTEINGGKGCEEYGVSAGFSIPIINKYNNKSLLNISGQYIRIEPKSTGMISETYLRLNIGITFNEGWFMKWKVK